MARLQLSLLGSFRLTLDDEPITKFATHNTRALLACLAVQAGEPHRREALASLFWPESLDQAAFRNLRQVLSRLRDAIGDRLADPPFVLTTRATIQLNPASDFWLDVTAFRQLINTSRKHAHQAGCGEDVKNLEQAVALYRGDFLSDLFGCGVMFEEWAVLQRESLHREMMEALRLLTCYYLRQGAYARAARHARRQVQLEPWCEEAQRQLMHTLALNGQRSAALAQYEACRAILATELGIEPAEETRSLYEQIRQDKLDPCSRSEKQEIVRVISPLPPGPYAPSASATLAEPSIPIQPLQHTKTPVVPNAEAPVYFFWRKLPPRERAVLARQSVFHHSSQQAVAPNKTRSSPLGVLQQRKLTHLFNVIDLDGDGAIQMQDFLRHATNVAQICKLDVTAPAYNQLVTDMMSWWNGVSAAAGKTHNDRVNLEEWLVFWSAWQTAVADEMGDGESHALYRLERSAVSTFDLFDTDGDGLMPYAGFHNWLRSWTIEVDITELFPYLDCDEDGLLSRADIAQLTKEFFLTNDPGAPGNHLYGFLPGSNNIQSIARPVFTP